jgi:hypothetical protein
MNVEIAVVLIEHAIAIKQESNIRLICATFGSKAVVFIKFEIYRLIARRGYFGKSANMRWLARGDIFFLYRLIQRN